MIDDRDEFWNLEGAARLVAEVRFPRGTPEEWAQEVIWRRPADAAEWRRSVVRSAQGVERALSALEFARLLVARDAQETINAAVLASGLQLFDPVTNRPTDETAGAFVLRSDVMSLLEAPSKPRRQVAQRVTQPTAKAKRPAVPAAGKSSTQTAANARWGHLEEFKTKALTAARSKHFESRAAAARHAADDLDDKPGGKRERYEWTTVDTWLKEAGWAPASTDE